MLILESLHRAVALPPVLARCAIAMMSQRSSAARRSIWKHGSRMRLVGTVSVMLCVVMAALTLPGATDVAAGQPGKHSTGQDDVQRLTGRWVRPDGGYVLELRDVKKEGGVHASYFNPRPINVSRPRPASPMSMRSSSASRG